MLHRVPACLVETVVFPFSLIFLPLLFTRLHPKPIARTPSARRAARPQAYISYHAPYPNQLCSKGNYFSTLQATSEAVISVLLLPSPLSIHAKSSSASIYSQPSGQRALFQFAFFFFFWSGRCCSAALRLLRQSLTQYWLKVKTRLHNYCQNIKHAFLNSKRTKQCA